MIRIGSMLTIIILLIACRSNEKVQDEKVVEQTVSVKAMVKDTLRESYLSKDYLMGKFDPSKHKSFSKIEAAFTKKEAIYMRTDAYEAFKEMAKSAQEVGITFNIISATRPFYYQKGIWERKWTGVTKVSGRDLTKSHPGFKQRALKIPRVSPNLTE